MFNVWEVYIGHNQIVAYTTSSLGIFVSLRSILDFTALIGSVILIFVLGNVGVFGCIIFCIFELGIMFVCYYFYWKVMGMNVFLMILCLVEVFAHAFQAVTVSNRITINVVSGTLFSYLTAILVMGCIIYFMVYTLLISYETGNMLFQFCIFVFLVKELFNF